MYAPLGGWTPAWMVTSLLEGLQATGSAQANSIELFIVLINIISESRTPSLLWESDDQICSLELGSAVVNPPTN